MKLVKDWVWVAILLLIVLTAMILVNSFFK